MIERCEIDELSIRKLYRLASGSYDPQIFRNECEQFSVYRPEESDDDVWRFSMGNEATLIVTLKTGPVGIKKINARLEDVPLVVLCASMSICWWDSYSKTSHHNMESWACEREEYNRCYNDALEKSIGQLGSPVLQGTDTDENQHKYSIWRGETGLLVLQQSAYDPQFGYDVNYWIQPWSGDNPHPTSPFIDWLCRLSNKS